MIVSLLMVHTFSKDIDSKLNYIDRRKINVIYIEKQREFNVLILSIFFVKGLFLRNKDLLIIIR